MSLIHLADIKKFDNILSVRVEKEAFANKSVEEAKCTIVTKQTLKKLNKMHLSFDREILTLDIIPTYMLTEIQIYIYIYIKFSIYIIQLIK